MKRIVLVILTFLVVFASFECDALGVSASSGIVMEFLTGEVIWEKDAYRRRPMASTTKIMTAICAIENSRLDDVVQVHPKAVGVEGSSMYLGYGETTTMESLLYGLMLASGNDAAIAIAMHVSGSVEGFSALMNSTASKIGVKDTNFTNPNGLDNKDHYTTAYDLALITRYAYGIPEFVRIVSTVDKKVPWQGRDYDRILHNHNKLLQMYSGCDGVKTGFTKKSGRCLVSGAVRNGIRVIAVTLNAPDDWNDHTAMLNYAFGNIAGREVVSSGQYLAGVMAINGDSAIVKAVAEQSFVLPVINGATSDIRLEYNVKKSVEAPVKFGDDMGYVDIYFNGNPVGKVKAISNTVCTRVEPRTVFKSLIKIFKSYFLMYTRVC